MPISHFRISNPLRMDAKTARNIPPSPKDLPNLGGRYGVCITNSDQVKSFYYESPYATEVYFPEFLIFSDA